jgi:WD40 repeat protein
MYDYEKVGFPTEAAFLPDGGDLVLGDAEGSVGLFDADTGDDLGRELVEADGRPVTAIDVAADGSRIVATFGPAEVSGRTAVAPESVAAVASVSGDDEVLFLDLPPDQKGAEATAAGFSADGRRILVGTSGGAIMTYDSSTGDHVETVQAHHHAVRDIVDAGEASGSMLTTGGSSESTLDQVVLVSEEGSRTIPSRDELIAATISADGESVIMFTAGGVVRSLPIDDQELGDLVDSKVAYDLTPELCRSYGVSGC